MRRCWERPFSSWYFVKLLPIRVYNTEPDGPIVWFVTKQLLLFKKEISHILHLQTSNCQIHFLTFENRSWSFPCSFALSFFDFFFSFSLTVSNCVAGYRGAASPSAMLLDLWFPVKHNESYIRLFKVRWCTICSQAWKTLSNRDQQKATVHPFHQNIHIHIAARRQMTLPSKIWELLLLLQFSPKPDVFLWRFFFF